ncbi:peptidoglycan-binding domain-containing protein [Leptothermofonsia sp. ETS-13]|uniref:peptidoglycan-binding domain-containing protein n=1 Tax=Leptothermofonsia sp. ETS-13 TaxID=3035696 RepID=UPI003BA29E60
MRAYLKPGSLRSLTLTFAMSFAVIGISTAAGLSQQSGAPAAGGVDGTATEAVSRSTLKPGSKGNDVTELQATLKLLGFYNGAVDGVYGQTTVNAVYSFQQAAGLDADGIAGPATWGRLFPTTPVAAPPPSSLVSRPSSSKPASAAATSPNPNHSATAKPANPTLGSSPAKVAHVSPAPAGSTAIAAAKKPAHSIEGANSTPSSEVALPILRVGMKGPAVSGLQQRLRAIGVLKSSADGVFGPETQEAVKAAQRKFNLEADGVVGPATWSQLLQ